jgi:magnesium transporter
MIRGLATGEIQFRSLGTIILREIIVGLMLGIITGGVIILRSSFLPPGVDLYEGLVIGTSLSLVVIVANLIGTIAPLVIHKLGADPAVMSTPLITTLIDVCGLTIYFETARYFLGL